MAYHTIEDGPWPQGVTVAVYPVASVDVGSPIDTAIAQPDGTATFGGLTEGAQYTAVGSGGTQTFYARNAEAQAQNVDALVAGGDAGAIGSTDTTQGASLQARADAAFTAGKKFRITSGVYNLGTTTLRLWGNVEADPDAILQYSGTGVAVVIGRADHDPLYRLRIELPQIVQTSKAWGADVGLRVEAIYAAHIWVPYIQSFGCGLDEVGGAGGGPVSPTSQGCSYNTFYLGHFDNNKINQRLQPQSAAAWTNQNTHIGGRWSHNTGEVSAGTRHCLLVNQVGGQQPNNNVWINPSLETPGVVEYALYIDGANNQWIDTRHEGATASFGKVRLEGADPARPVKKNRIDGGFSALDITVEQGANVGANEITEVGGRHRMVGGTAAGYVCLANVNSVNSPSLLIGDSADLLTADLTSAYFVALAANILKTKAKADTFSRWEMDTTTGQQRRGTGAAAPITSFLHGSGTPEGNQTAGLGSIYQDRAGVGLNSLYYKAVGSGNTGWVAFQTRQQAIATDANFTLTPHTSPERTRHTGTLTADRTITLSTTNAQAGQEFTITRTGAGAFNLIVGGLKNLATGQWCRVTYDGAAWYLSEFGSL